MLSRSCDSIFWLVIIPVHYSVTSLAVSVFIVFADCIVAPESFSNSVSYFTQYTRPTFRAFAMPVVQKPSPETNVCKPFLIFNHALDWRASLGAAGLTGQAKVCIRAFVYQSPSRLGAICASGADQADPARFDNLCAASRALVVARVVSLFWVSRSHSRSESSMQRRGRQITTVVNHDVWILSSSLGTEKVAFALA